MLGHTVDETTYVTSMVPVPNVHQTPAEDFAVLRRDADRAVVVGRTLVGFLHTHPAGFLEPSDSDYLGLPDGLVGVVMCGTHLTGYTKEGPAQVEQVPPTV